jgi:hypothetical protein
MKNLIAFSLLFLFYSCVSDTKQQTVQPFTALAGDWQMPEGDGFVTESWKQINDTLLEGRSDYKKGDSIIPFETIQLLLEKDSFYYKVKAAGQNNELPVAFTITSFSDSGFVAENKQHDFPKRISYTFINKDSIYARVDDGLAVPERKAEYYYKRLKQ